MRPLTLALLSRLRWSYSFCDGGCDAPGREGDASKRFPAGADRLNVPPYHINTEEGLAHRTIWPSVRHANSLHQYECVCCPRSVGEVLKVTQCP